MPRIYSWKLSDKTYAYLVNPDKTNESCLRKRITNSEELKTMVNTINTWTESEYQTRFNEMNEKIIKNYGVSIPWNSSFFNDTDTAITTIIDNDFDRDEYKSEILNEISSNIDEIIGSLNLENDASINDLRNTITNTNLSVLTESKDYIDEKVAFLTKTISDNKNLFDTKLGELQTTVGDFYVEVENKTGNITEIENEVTSHRKHFEDITKRIDIVQGNVENSVEDAVTEKFKDINVTLDEKIFGEVNTIIDSMNFSGQIDTALSSFEDRFGRRIGDVESSIDDFKNNLSGFSGNIVSFRDEVENFRNTIGSTENLVSDINTIRTQLTNLGTRVENAETNVTSLTTKVDTTEGKITTINNNITTINNNISAINSDFTTLSTTLGKTGITFSPSAREPLGASMSPHVSGYNYRTSTGHEIIVDDEIIELKSDKARIYIDDTGIHLEGDVFINGVKIK